MHIHILNTTTAFENRGVPPLRSVCVYVRSCIISTAWLVLPFTLSQDAKRRRTLTSGLVEMICSRAVLTGDFLSSFFSFFALMFSFNSLTSVFYCCCFLFSLICFVLMFLLLLLMKEWLIGCGSVCIYHCTFLYIIRNKAICKANTLKFLFYAEMIISFLLLSTDILFSFLRVSQNHLILYRFPLILLSSCFLKFIIFFQFLPPLS